MGSIDICTDGLLAFLAAAVMADTLASCLAVFSLRVLVEARRKRERFSRQPLYRQLVGMSVSLCCCFCVMLLVLSGTGTPRPRSLNVWLDKSVLLWTNAALALWPAISYAFSRRLRRQSASRGANPKLIRGWMRRLIRSIP